MIVTNPRWYEDEHRAHICEWMGANGIDYGKVPVHATVTVADGVIMYPRITSFDASGMPVTETATQPLTVKPDRIVARWLTPRGGDAPNRP